MLVAVEPVDPGLRSGSGARSPSRIRSCSIGLDRAEHPRVVAGRKPTSGEESSEASTSVVS